MKRNATMLPRDETREKETEGKTPICIRDFKTPQ